MVSVFKGAINFGLINIPVKLSPATSKETLPFRSLHSECKTPINQKRWCNKCNKEVKYENIVKGFEYEKGSFVEIAEVDIKSITKSSKYIQIADFIKLEEIDPIYYDKSYYIIPEQNGEKPYLILYNAMKETRRVAVAKITMREKEQLCIIRIYEDILLMNTMFFHAEIRTSAEIDIDKIRKKADVSELETSMAKQIVENLTSPFLPDKYHDRYREEFMKIIEAKIEGNATIRPDIPELNTIDYSDIMAKLKASVEATKNTQLKVQEKPDKIKKTNEKPNSKKTAKKMPPLKPVSEKYTQPPS